MQVFEEDKIYILGGIPRGGVSRPLTAKKANREGIRTLRLPLEEILWKASATKDLPIYQVLKILSNFRQTGNWQMSLETALPNKIRTLDEVIEEQLTKMKKVEQFRVKELFQQRVNELE